MRPTAAVAWALLACVALFTPGLDALDTASCDSDSVPLVTVDGAHVDAQLKALAQFNDAEFPAVTRVLFTPTDVQARGYIKQLMGEAGMVIREDLMGNIYGKFVGSEPALPGILTGSHTDAIPLSGMYDGTLGVIGGIEAVAALRRAGFKPKRSIEVLMFTSEEPTRFGLSCSGSRAMAGVLDPAKVETLTDKVEPNGTYAGAAASAGYGGGKTLAEMVQDARIPAGAYHAFVELHIEQGPELEDEGIKIGAVTGIAAPAALKVDFYGDGGHAGGQLMYRRNDAGLAGAELALRVEAEALAGTRDSVGTTGTFQVSPGAVNSVPRHAHLEIDIRDVDGAQRDLAVANVIKAAAEIAERRKVRHTMESINRDPPAQCSEMVIAAIEQSAEQYGLSHKRMVSRAYHDSLFMALLAPTSMVFVPCRGGVSHRPDEHVKEEDLAAGVQVLAATMARLSLA